MATHDKGAGSSDGKGTFTLLLFASAATYAGVETLSLPAPSTLREVFASLERRFPGITHKVLTSAAITVNLDYVDFEWEDTRNRNPDLDRDGNGGSLDGGKEGGGDAKRDGDGDGLDLVIRSGDEVGIIPPVSSG